MAKAVIDTARCKGCLLCVSFCPKKALAEGQELNSLGVKTAVFSGSCSGCASCAVMCPECCIEVYK